MTMMTPFKVVNVPVWVFGMELVLHNEARDSTESSPPMDWTFDE